LAARNAADRERCAPHIVAVRLAQRWRGDMIADTEANMLLDGEDGRPHVYNRRGENVQLADVRAAIMRELRLFASVLPLAHRASAVTKLLADPRWLRSCSGQYLGATARDGASACFRYLGDKP
jgi:hypothetical protein